MIELRLTHPSMDFWVDVRLRRIGDAWLAVADLASAPEPAVASRPVARILRRQITRLRDRDEHARSRHRCPEVLASAPRQEDAVVNGAGKRALGLDRRLAHGWSPRLRSSRATPSRSLWSANLTEDRRSDAAVSRGPSGFTAVALGHGRPAGAPPGRRAARGGPGGRVDRPSPQLTKFCRHSVRG